MKLRRLATLGVLLAVSVHFVGSVFSQEPETPAPENASKLSDTALRIALKEAAALGTGHRKLKTIKKQYELKIKYWRRAGAEPLESKGRSDTDRILGARFMTQTIDARWNDQTFEGFAIVGYDNPTDEYVLSWQSTLHTDIFVARGKSASKGKVITFFGDYRDPISGKISKIKVTMKVVNKKGETLITVYDVTSSESGFKFLEIKSKRLIRAAA